MRGFLYFIIVCMFSSLPSLAQEITEENYQKINKEIWGKYEEDIHRLYHMLEEYPEKKDSLRLEMKKVNEKASQQNIDAAIKYASVPSGLQRVFMVRLDLSKVVISSILETLPAEMKESPYVQSLQLHIDSNQINEGDKCFNFKGIDSDGEEFSLSSLEGKRILLLYGGLDCMREDGRKYLDDLYQKTSGENFIIVTYWPCSSLQELKNLKDLFTLNCLHVSDFLEDHSPVKIIYGTQATPTCFWVRCS